MSGIAYVNSVTLVGQLTGDPEFRKAAGWPQRL
jgi:single-stranded DNA-binding protein